MCFAIWLKSTTTMTPTKAHATSHAQAIRFVFVRRPVHQRNHPVHPSVRTAVDLGVVFVQVPKSSWTCDLERERSAHWAFNKVQAGTRLWKILPRVKSLSLYLPRVKSLSLYLPRVKSLSLYLNERETGGWKSGVCLVIACWLADRGLSLKSGRHVRY